MYAPCIEYFKTLTVHEKINAKMFWYWWFEHEIFHRHKKSIMLFIIRPQVELPW